MLRAILLGAPIGRDALRGRAPARSAAARPMIESGAAPPMVDALRRVRRCNGVACLDASFAVSATRARECRWYSALSIIAPSVNVLRRTRRKPSTIRGAAPDVVIGQSTAARAGARPYHLQLRITSLIACERRTCGSASYRRWRPACRSVVGWATCSAAFITI